jgi:hypothetical protein
MKLALVGCTNAALTTHLANHFELSNDAECVYINWCKTASKTTLSTQVEELQISINNGKKIVLFDQDFSLNKDEIKYLIKYDSIVLCEPALCYRRHFEYLPFPIEQHTVEHINKKYDFFETVSSKVLLDEHIDVYPSVLTAKNVVECKFVIICPTAKEINIGYLEDLNKYLQVGCVPLILHEHKYFSNLNWITLHASVHDIEYVRRTYNTIHDALITAFYDNMHAHYPEMSVAAVAQKIAQLFE